MKKTLYNTIFITIIILFASCGGNSVEINPSISDTTSLKIIEKNITTPKLSENLFDDPRGLTIALSKNGIGNLKEWGNPIEMGWGSLTDYYQFGTQKNNLGMQNNIAYYLEGTEATVKRITINLNINNSSEKRDALTFLNQIAEKTFKSLNIKSPANLSNAILAPKKYKEKIRGFVISFDVIKSKIETWKLNIDRD